MARRQHLRRALFFAMFGVVACDPRAGLKASSDFEPFLVEADKAQLELQRGNPERYTSAQFHEGRNEIARLAFGASGDVGYLVQTEHLIFKTPGRTESIERRHRVTMLFRREDGAWRIFHRHADSQLEKAAPM